MTKRSIVLIGAGKMGGALLAGWLKDEIIKPASLIILDPKPGDIAQKAIAEGALHLEAPDETLADVKQAVLAIKPQLFDRLAPDISTHLPKNALVISILAGTSMIRIQDKFGDRPIIRAMPNTPAAIGEGVIAFTTGPHVTDAQVKLTERLLRAAGSVYAVDNEHLIDVVTAVSGSGPAYLFHLVEALEAAALHIGLPEELAPVFARQTIIGAAALLDSSDETARNLRKNVTSPGGTTEAALDVLMDTPGLSSLMRKAVSAALKRAKELA